MVKSKIWMIVGCILPLVLIFFAPSLGFGTGSSLLIFIIAMFVCHLLMPMHHGNHNHINNDSNLSKKSIDEQHH